MTRDSGNQSFQNTKSRFMSSDINSQLAAPLLMELSNVGHRYSDSAALRGVNLTLRQGDFVFLTGASGAGKTTLLRIMSGDLRPSQGTINYHDPDLFITHIFQDLKLIDGLSVSDNLDLAYDPQTFRNRRDFESSIKDISQALGLQDYMNKKICNLNGGMKQKVAIVRALLPGPDILVADEPTSSLDFENSKRLFDVFSFYNQKRKLTIIWASHNRELVRKFGGKMAHLEKGVLVHMGHACFI